MLRRIDREQQNAAREGEPSTNALPARPPLWLFEPGRHAGRAVVRHSVSVQIAS